MRISGAACQVAETLLKEEVTSLSRASDRPLVSSCGLCGETAAMLKLVAPGSFQTRKGSVLKIRFL